MTRDEMSLTATTHEPEHVKYPSNIDHGGNDHEHKAHHLIDRGLPGAGNATGFDPEKQLSTGLNSYRSSEDEGTQYASPSMIRTSSRLRVHTKGFPESDVSSEDVQIAERALSWQQAAALLFTEYVVLAILSFPSSFAILGMAGGVIATFLIALTVLYTSHLLWRYCSRHREIRDICDAAWLVCGKSKIAWTAAFIGLAINNWFIMGLHINAGTVAINTLGYTFCSAVWGIICLIIMFSLSLVRNFNHAMTAGLISAGTMFVCFLVVVIGHSVQGNPNGWVAATATTPATDLSWTVWAPPGTTFVQGMSALLNIAYTFLGQALIPSFIGDMARPEEFPKALYASMTLEVILFTVCGAVVFAHTGTALTTAPAYGTLIAKYARPAAALVLPTIFIVGVLYSTVTSRSIFFQIFPETSIHRRKHTFKGWGVWVAIVAGGWAIAYVIGESIPFFNDLLTTISSIFGSWFGYIIWAGCWFSMSRERTYKRSGALYYAEFALNILILVIGFFFFGAGTYTAVQSIINSYAKGSIKAPFTCVNTGFTFGP